MKPYGTLCCVYFLRHIGLSEICDTHFVQDQLNLRKVRQHENRICHLFLVMQDQISFWGLLDPMIERGSIDY